MSLNHPQTFGNRDHLKRTVPLFTSFFRPQGNFLSAFHFHPTKARTRSRKPIHTGMGEANPENRGTAPSVLVGLISMDRVKKLIVLAAHTPNSLFYFNS